MPEPVSTVEHQATADVVTILTHLLEHGGWIRPADLAALCGVHRDTVGRILAQLALSGWAEQRDLDGRPRYRIGAELPRIGLAFLELLQREQQAVRARFDAATVPHDWAPGSGNRMTWQPAPSGFCRETP